MEEVKGRLYDIRTRCGHYVLTTAERARRIIYDYKRIDKMRVKQSRRGNNTALSGFLVFLLPSTERSLALGDKLKPINQIRAADCAP